MLTLETTATAAYVVAALLFILALAGLSKHETSRAGATSGIVGMAIALAATIVLAIDGDVSAVGGVLLGISFAPAAFLGHFTVFVLAVIVGYYVISNVSHSLHTPLMAQTNAISGIILVGALLQIGDDSWLVTVLAVIAASVASINVFGGFLVANRMIRMFRKDA